MEGYSISFTLGKASANHGGNVEHNKRDKNSSTPLKKKINRWFFYVYYPLHMIVLIIIAQI